MKRKMQLVILTLVLISGLGSCGGAAKISQGLVYSYQECADGWPSPSIGRQGACSHHGGVVTRTVDHRTGRQRALSYGLNMFGVMCLLTFLFCLSVLGSVSLSSDHRATVAIASVHIEGESASVPLTIAGETRIVNVVRIDENTYETSKSVALVKCPEGKRRSVYMSKIKFHGRNGDYRQDLSTWIHTGRGRSGGYNSRAFGWNTDI